MFYKCSYNLFADDILSEIGKIPDHEQFAASFMKPNFHEDILIKELSTKSAHPRKPCKQSDFRYLSKPFYLRNHVM